MNGRRWIAPRSPGAIDRASRLQPPSATHWFGTDELGRDILSRVIYGARISMLVGASVVAGSLLLGLILGSTVAENNSIKLSPPKATRAGLCAAQAAHNESAASAPIQMIVIV